MNEPRNYIVSTSRTMKKTAMYVCMYLVCMYVLGMYVCTWYVCMYLVCMYVLGLYVCTWFLYSAVLLINATQRLTSSSFC